MVMVVLVTMKMADELLKQRPLYPLFLVVSPPLLLPLPLYSRSYSLSSSQSSLEDLRMALPTVSLC